MNVCMAQIGATWNQTSCGEMETESVVSKSQTFSTYLL